MARASPTKKKTQNKRRKGFGAVLFPWLRRFGVSLAVIIGVVWIGAWIILSESDDRAAFWAEQKIISASARAGFVVTEILVEGRVHTNLEILKALINIQQGDPLLAFKPSAAKKMIEKIEWVESAKVQRRFPGTIYIGLKEHEPIAIYQHNQSLSLINAHGEEITDKGIDRFSDLLIVLGKGAAPKAAAMIGRLKTYPEIRKRLKSIKYVGERRWDLITKNNTIVLLPEEDTGKALEELSQHQKSQKILNSNLQTIDLRIPQRMIIKAPAGQAQDYKQDYKSGVQPNKSNNI